MKIALLALPGLAQGALVGTALGIGAGLAWVEIFKTMRLEDNSWMLVFPSLMSLRLAIDGIRAPGCSASIAIRDACIATRCAAITVK
jgi:hypothetical protein